MKMSVEFRPEAETESNEAFDWYEKEKAGLGSRFRDAVEEKIETIAQRPNIFPKIVDTRFRRAVLEKFPFIIIFALENNTIVVASVFHTSRDPIILRGRFG